MFFYCRSFQAFFSALTLRAKGEEVIILSMTEDIIKTCELLKIPYIPVRSYRLNDILKNHDQTVQEIKRIAGLIEKGSLHFSHTQFDVFCFLLVAYASDFAKVDIYFHNFEYQYNKSKPRMTREWLYMAYAKVIIRSRYKVRLMIKEIANVTMLGIDDRFIKKHRINTIDDKDSYYNSIFEVFKKMQLPIEPMRNLYLGLDYGVIQRIVHLVKYKELETVLMGSDIAVKHHPYFNSARLEFEREIPSHLPAELLFSSVQNAVISLHSAALITASRFPEIKAISLLELVPFVDEGFKQNIKRDLAKKSEGKILFPSNLDELTDML